MTFVHVSVTLFMKQPELVIRGVFKNMLLVTKHIIVAEMCFVSSMTQGRIEIKGQKKLVMRGYKKFVALCSTVSRRDKQNLFSACVCEQVNFSKQLFTKLTQRKRSNKMFRKDFR